MDFAHNDQNIGVSIDYTLKNQQEMKDVSELQSSYKNIHDTTEASEHKKILLSLKRPQNLNEGTINEDASDTVQQNISQTVPDPDSTTSGIISSETEEAIDTLIADLGKLHIPAKPVTTVNPHELTASHNFLSDNQLPANISITEIVVRSDSKTPLARNRIPSKKFQFSYLTSFESSCDITCQALSNLIDEYIQGVTRGLLKSHANK
ncbi:hypothetical protein R3W88_014808 [Solanum pinnatisectum]|uniref:Uncharacterized protein n=1 Tax=Solanum pinnatisectum TaxID=50273 RepID=A0AAV9KSP8_9SOLN|nr:hypothetical protein R3W88_014808 [Solanum pinnatisectum]